jgi:hypothetical protein
LRAEKVSEVCAEEVAVPSKQAGQVQAIAPTDAQQQQLFIRMLGKPITAMPTIRP